MITTSQYRELDRNITEHLKRLTALHMADARGNHSKELADATVVSWRNILVNLLELANPHQNYHVSADEYAVILPMIQDVTTAAGIVETLREKRIIAEEEGIGKHLKEVIDKKLDTAKENRNTAYEKFRKYMLALLDYGAEE